MPRRPKIGNRDRILELLTDAERAALRSVCEELDIVDWATSRLYEPMAATAAVRLVRRYLKMCMAERDAVRVACEDLGLNRATVRSWCRRMSAVPVHNAADTGQHSRSVVSLAEARFRQRKRIG